MPSRKSGIRIGYLWIPSTRVIMFVCLEPHSTGALLGFSTKGVTSEPENRTFQIKSASIQLWDHERGGTLTLRVILLWRSYSCCASSHRKRQPLINDYTLMLFFAWQNRKMYLRNAARSILPAEYFLAECLNRGSVIKGDFAAYDDNFCSDLFTTP